MPLQNLGKGCEVRGRAEIAGGIEVKIRIEGCGKEEEQKGYKYGEKRDLFYAERAMKIHAQSGELTLLEQSRNQNQVQGSGLGRSHLFSILLQGLAIRTRAIGIQVEYCIRKKQLSIPVYRSFDK